MHAVSATEFARNFRHMLDQVEYQGITISIVRNKKQVATVVPQLPGMRKPSAATILPPRRCGYVSLAESGFLYQRFRHPGPECLDFEKSQVFQHPGIPWSIQGRR